MKLCILGLVSANKPFASLDTQVQILVSRKMCVQSLAHATDYLLKTHYYRFTGYSRLWQINPSLPSADKTANKKFYDSYHPSANFDFVCQIVAVDAQVRSLLFEALSKVEITLRSLFAYEMSKAYELRDGSGNRSFYLDPSEYDGTIPIPKGASTKKIFEIRKHNEQCPDEIAKLIAGIRRDLDVAHAAPSSVKHYAVSGDVQNDYSMLPLWVAVEHISFGKLSKMFSYTAEQEVIREIAKKCGIMYSDFPETLRALAVLRNLCAHHRQLWNITSVVTIPKSKRAAKNYARRQCSDKSFYTAVFTMRYLLEQLKIPHRGMEKIEQILSDNPLYTQFFTYPIGLKRTIWEDFRCHHIYESCRRDKRCECHSFYSSSRPDIHRLLSGFCIHAQTFFMYEEVKSSIT